MTAPTDTELIRQFLEARDETSFRELYARHTPPLYGLLCRLTGGRAGDASDVLQDAWTRAAAKLSAFRGESQFRTWLTGIALNCYREWRRTLREPDEEAASTAQAAVDSRDHALDVERILATLPTSHREVLVLHDVEGYTHEEIARALGIEPGTSKSRLSRARQIFRSSWRAGDRSEVRT